MQIAVQISIQGCEPHALEGRTPAAPVPNPQAQHTQHTQHHHGPHTQHAQHSTRAGAPPHFQSVHVRPGAAGAGGLAAGAGSGRPGQRPQRFYLVRRREGTGSWLVCACRGRRPQPLRRKRGLKSHQIMGRGPRHGSSCLYQPHSRALHHPCFPCIPATHCGPCQPPSPSAFARQVSRLPLDFATSPACLYGSHAPDSMCDYCAPSAAIRALLRLVSCDPRPDASAGLRVYDARADEDGTGGTNVEDERLRSSHGASTSAPGGAFVAAARASARWLSTARHSVTGGEAAAAEEEAAARAAHGDGGGAEGGSAELASPAAEVACRLAAAGGLYGALQLLHHEASPRPP
jgi:hypothetical protein